ncbi:copper uptake system-associated protein [Hyphomicrobium sp.]|uniref:copper uptake system-associated protein n=1 Tax=Hyphomicrobium sp. TaxID=82 RepID=UPI003F717518
MRSQRSGSSRISAALLACAGMALSGAIPFPSPALAHDDAASIREVIGSTWDKPGSKVETRPVVVSGDHAVASWTQGDRGGRALLRRNGGIWTVALCSGDPLRSAGWLAEAGVPHADADRMANALATAEALEPAERRAKFSLFEGTVTGDAPSHHPAPVPHHQH